MPVSSPYIILGSIPNSADPRVERFNSSSLFFFWPAPLPKMRDAITQYVFGSKHTKFHSRWGSAKMFRRGDSRLLVVGRV